MAKYGMPIEAVRVPSNHGGHVQIKPRDILYNLDRFVGHASQGVPDVPKYGRCHGVTKGPDERSENVTNLIVAIWG